MTVPPGIRLQWALAVVMQLAGTAALGASRVPFVDVFTGWGTPEAFTIRGRSYEVLPSEIDEVRRSRFATIRENVNQFRMRDLGQAEVEVEVGGLRARGRCDREGLFQMRIAAPGGVLQPGTSPVHAWVLDVAGRRREPVSTGAVQLVAPTSRVGLISDIDDTVLVTHVLERLTMIRNTLSRSVDRMEPATGMADLYRAVAAAQPRTSPVGFFYISGSPTGLHRKLEAFLAHNGFPAGSLVLRRIGGQSFVPTALRTWRPFSLMSAADPIFDTESFKVQQIGAIMESLPAMRFILVGDSGERDPESYRRVCSDPRFGGRVLAIYIRNVTGEPAVAPRFAGQTLFDDPSPVVRELVRRGLARRGTSAP